VWLGEAEGDEVRISDDTDRLPGINIECTEPGMSTPSDDEVWRSSGGGLVM